MASTRLSMPTFETSLIDKKARKAADSREIREHFSELQTVWRWFQSAANLSLLEIPVNREIYRESADAIDNPGDHTRDFLGFSEFSLEWPQFVTGSEQGRSRERNRD